MAIVLFGESDSGKETTLFGSKAHKLGMPLLPPHPLIPPLGIHAVLLVMCTGVLQLGVEEIFRGVKEAGAGVVIGQYWEVHNELVRDLSNPENTDLKVLPDPDYGPVVTNITTKEVVPLQPSPLLSSPHLPDSLPYSTAANEQ